MDPSSLRLRNRHDHRALRRRAARVERTARAVADGVLPRGFLEADLDALRRTLARHLGWEDRALEALGPRGTGPGSPLARMADVHRDLREVLDFCDGAGGCADGATPLRLLVSRALGLALLVRDELAREEGPAAADDPLRGGAA